MSAVIIAPVVRVLRLTMYGVFAVFLFFGLMLAVCSGGQVRPRLPRF